MTPATKTTFFLLVSLSSFIRGMDAAGTKTTTSTGTCACRNPGFDTAATPVPKCWGTLGTPSATCTAVTMARGTYAGNATTAGAACPVASLHKDDCEWTAFGACTSKSGQTCTETEQSPCETDTTNCVWTTGFCAAIVTPTNDVACAAHTGDTDAQNATDCGNDTDCQWVTHTCGCKVDGKNDAATPVATCYSAAAQVATLCSAQKTNDALATGCANTDVPSKADHCTWVAHSYEATLVPTPIATGVCACANPGYDSAGTTEKCWKTAGTAKADCAALKTGTAGNDTDEAASLTACGANTDCLWTAISGGTASSCGCAVEGKNAAATPVATCYKDAAQVATLCSAQTTNDALATGCANTDAPSKADHCKWLMPESDCPTAATPTPTPCPSSAVAPGALLAFLAGALAFLRC